MVYRGFKTVRKITFPLQLITFLGLLALTCPPVLSAEEGVPLTRAQGESLATAVGHYARTRALLNEAIREFDRGLALADPDTLLDVQRWRATLVERAQELEKVLDPQPRATRSGVKFNADKRLLNEAKEPIR